MKQLAVHPVIRYPMTDAPEDYPWVVSPRSNSASSLKSLRDKVFLTLQADFASLDWDDEQKREQQSQSDIASFKMIKYAIYRDAPRIATGEDSWIVLR